MSCMNALARMSVAAFCEGPEPTTEADYIARVRITGTRPTWSDVVAVMLVRAKEQAWERITTAGADKRTAISPKPEANELKGALALNARDDTRPAERDKARTMLEAYAKARGESGWAAAADAIIAARNRWASRIMEVEMYEEIAWVQLQAATSAEQVASVEKQITEAIRGV